MHGISEVDRYNQPRYPYIIFWDRGYDDEFTVLPTVWHHDSIIMQYFLRVWKAISAHQGFCVYEALAYRDMIMCILTARRPVYNESFHCYND